MTVVGSTVVGQVFVAVLPESAGFVGALEGQLKGLVGLGGVVGGGFGAALGASAAVAAVAGLAKIGEEFQNARFQIERETGATGGSLDKLGQTVTDAFRGVPVSLGAAATAVDELFRRGVPLGPQLEALAKQELFLAKVTKEDLGATVEATTGLMQKFNVPVADQSRELDVLFKAYQKSGQGLSVLTGALQTGGGVLQQFGFSLDKSAALLASLERSGVNLGPALAGLRLAFGKITTAGGDPQKVLADLLKEFTDGTPKAKALADAIQLFGKRSGAELSIAISKGKFDVAALFKEITDGKNGIVATGLATQTLGDQFRLLRNNVEADLSGIGTTVLHAFEDTFKEAAGPVEDLTAAISHLVLAASPAGSTLAAVFAPLKLAAPLTADLAAGVNLAASGLDRLPPEVLAAAGALALYTFVSTTATGATLAFAAAAKAAAAIEFLTSPIGIAIGTLVAVGAAVRVFQQESDQAREAAKRFGAGIFDTANQTGIYKGGVDSAAASTRQWLDSLLKAENADTKLRNALSITGQTTTSLANAITGSTAGWKQYEAAAFAASLADGKSGLASLALVRDLDKRRQAFEDGAKVELATAVATNQLSHAQEHAIEVANGSKKGTLDYAGALDDANKKIAENIAKTNARIQATTVAQTSEAELTKELAAGTITSKELEDELTKLGLKGPELARQLAIATDAAKAQNQAQDLLVLKTVTTTKGYADLARQIAQGTITQHDAEIAAHGLGISLDGVGRAVSDLRGQVDAFVNGAISQLPTVATAINDFTSAISGDKSTLESDLKQRQDLAQRLADSISGASVKTQQQLAAVNLTISQDQNAIATLHTNTTDKLQRDLLRRSQIIAGSGKASDDLKREIEKNNAEIIADNKKLADDSSPKKFTENLFNNAVTILKFTANLKTLFNTPGLASLAGELAKLGPAAAGQLADALASDPAKAKIAGKAAELGKTATDAYTELLKAKAPEALGLGPAAEQGASAVGVRIADTIVAELLKRIPELHRFGITASDEIGAGAKESDPFGQVIPASLAAARLHIPEFRGLGASAITAVNAGASESTRKATFTADLLAALAAKGAEFRTTGVGLGGAVDEGIAAGIILAQDAIGNAVVIMTQGVVKHVESQWVVKSPSKVFSDIGEQVGAGVAQGITISAPSAADAARRLAADTQATFDGLLNVAFAPTFAPRIEPHVAPIVVPPIPPVDLAVNVPKVPPVAPVVIPASFGPLASPVLPRVAISADLTATLPTVPAVTIPARLGPVDPPVVPPVVVPAQLAELTAPVVPPVTIAANVGPIAPPVVPAVAISVQPPNLVPFTSAVDTSLSDLTASAQDTTAKITTSVGASLVDRLRRAFGLLTDTKSVGEFVHLASSLVGTFDDAFQKITVDAGELQKVLDSLTLSHSLGATTLSKDIVAKLIADKLLIPKTAPVAPPSAVQIIQAEQSLQVQSPQDRADARRQQDAAAKARSPFDGATVNFPVNADPLHIAAEIAWASK